VDWIADDKRLVFGFCVVLGGVGIGLANRFSKQLKEARVAGGVSSSSAGSGANHPLEEKQELLEAEG